MDTQAERLMELRRLLANKDDARHISIPGDPSYAMFEDLVQGGKIARAEWFEKNANELESLLTERASLLARVDELGKGLRTIAAYKLSGPPRPGQIKNEHRAIISLARSLLPDAGEGNE